MSSQKALLTTTFAVWSIFASSLGETELHTVTQALCQL
jgi:hypothetical protein